MGSGKLCQEAAAAAAAVAFAKSPRRLLYALRMPHIKIVLFLYFVLVLILVLVFLWTSPTCQRAHSCLSMPQIQHRPTRTHLPIYALYCGDHTDA